MPQKFVNLENLTSFWGNAKEYIGNERKEIEDQLYNWQKTEKAPMVQYEPVPNSELHPVVEFKFKETLPEGEKGPNNPSIITGVSTVSVKRQSKNLLTYLGKEGSDNSIVSVQSDGSLLINGTISEGNVVTIKYSLPWNNTGIVLNTDKYIVSVNNVIASNTVRISCRGLVLNKWAEVKGNDGYMTSANFTRVITPRYENAAWDAVFIQLYPNTYSNVVLKPQLELGTVATEFEPSDQNVYTIQLGNTYYGGSVDFVTGLMTVTQFCLELTSSNLSGANYAEATFGSRLAININGGLMAFPKADFSIIPDNFTLSHFTYHYPTGDGLNYGFFWASFPYLTFQDANYQITTSGASAAENKQAFLDWFDAQSANNNPVILTYKLATPITIQLTPQQIKSLSSLEGTSKRINTIYTDADSVQVEYQKYVGIDSTLNSDSVNAIQNKVVNSALNTKVSLTGDETIAGSKTFSSPINGNITGDAGTVAGHIVSKDVPVNAAFTDTTYDPATQSTAGLMSASDKVKLDAVGSVFSFKGSVVNSSSLPASDNINGDAYLAEDTGHVYVYDGTNFVDIGTWSGIPSATDAQIDALFED